MNYKKIQEIIKTRTLSVSRDVVGIEVGANLPQGTPAVRMHINKNQVELLAAGFLKLNEDMPGSAAELEDMPAAFWTLPKAFQASKAAIAITSKEAILRQTSDTGEQDSNKDHLRKASLKTDPQHPPIVSSMPDFLASWAASKFQEGHRPTTRSIQTSLTAALNCFLCGPVPASSKKPAAVIFCFGHHCAITMFYENRVILYREHPIGYLTIKEAISAKMGIDISMAETMMDDPVIDITPVINPLLDNLYRQVDISADYLARRKGCTVKNFYIYGLPCGINHWTSTFKHMVNKPLHHLHPFGGLSCSNKKLLLPNSFEKTAPLFISAIGAARALLEDL